MLTFACTPSGQACCDRWLAHHWRVDDRTDRLPHDGLFVSLSLAANAELRYQVFYSAKRDAKGHPDAIYLKIYASYVCGNRGLWEAWAGL